MSRFFLAAAALFAIIPTSFTVARAQIPALTCATTATPLLIRAEGITERTGDIVISCSGGNAGAQFTENVTVSLNVNVTNRIDANNVTDMILEADSGSGPQLVTVPGVLVSPTTVSWNGAKFKLSPQGALAITIANLRGNATQAIPSPGGQIFATLAVSGTGGFSVNNAALSVATTTPGLYTNHSSTQVCNQTGASVPGNSSFASFISAGAIFFTTRVTEGFAAALAPKADQQNLDADTGHRILVQYSGFPTGTQLYLPVAVAGSDALQPTAGGDFGPPASGGKYAPGKSSLLLSLVSGADANGAGGTPLYTPGAAGSPAVTFDALQQIPVAADGSASAVYEVMDSSDFSLETAQFPTFVNIPKIFTGQVYQTNETVMLAPVSTVITASTSAPIPRFVATPAASDCAVLNDCSADYFPHVTTDQASLTYTVVAGSISTSPLQVSNSGTGTMDWSASATYQNGSGWLYVYPSNGTNSENIYVAADARQLSPGVYHGTVEINAGPAGIFSIPVTLTVAAPAAGSAPTITSVTSSANFWGGPITAGSLATIMGTNFNAANVSVEFDNQPATILFRNTQQINLLVPAGLTAKGTTEMTLMLDTTKVGPVAVAIAPFAPAIFPGAILNQDSSVNGSAHAAAPGSVIQIFGTGVSTTGTVTGIIGGEIIGHAYYAGAAPGLPGVQQVNLRVPADAQSGTAQVQICEVAAGSSAAPACSAPMTITIGE